MNNVNNFNGTLYPNYQKYLNSYDGMNEEEKNIFDNYFSDPNQAGFTQGGCSKKDGMSRIEYLNLVDAKGKKLASLEKALSKLGVDEDEVKEIPPFSIGGFDYYGNNIIHGNEGLTNKYQITWLMFSDKQIYLYSLTFDMLSSSTSESCEEYFYKDVTNITTTQDQTEITVYTTSGGCGGAKKPSKSIETYNTFKVIVPGDTLKCGVYELNDELLNKIKAAKAKLREKKDQ